MKRSSTQTANQPQRVLLVDDVPLGTIARKSYLKDLGYEVETAVSGEAALDHLSGQSFDIMVTDYKMPGMDGIALIRQVRVTYPTLRTVMLTELADTLGLTEEQTGADAVLSKSAHELEQLARTVKRLLTKRKPVGRVRSKPLFMVQSS